MRCSSRTETGRDSRNSRALSQQARMAAASCACVSTPSMITYMPRPRAIVTAAASTGYGLFGGDDVGEEGAVELDPVDGVGVKPAEGGIAAAEAADRDAEPRGAKSGELVEGVLGWF